MRLSILSVIALVIALCIYSGCAARAAKLPAHWPIPQLTLPPDATAGQLAGFAGEQSKDGGRTVAGYVYESTNPMSLYAVAFKTATSWDDMVQQVWSELQPLGFEKTANEVEPALRWADFTLPDNSQIVRLIQAPPSADYSLLVFVTEVEP